MGRVYESLDDKLSAFIEAQHMFFVATSPAQLDGHINVSPKGLDSFRILGPRQVAYLDYTGSGIETVAHVRQNQRITFMFCAFEGRPNILRLYGKASVLEPETPGYDALLSHFKPEMPVRSIVECELTRIADACGFAVPEYSYVRQRQQLQNWQQKKNPQQLAEYWQEKNALSIDGLPGLRRTASPSKKP